MNDGCLSVLRRCGVQAGDHITVALSGGRDSVVLTHLLQSLSADLGITLSALHIHHGLRSASDGEEQFVRDLCKQWEIELEVEHLHLNPQGESVEMAAREARYALFSNRVDDHRFVATAHHLDDCMETFLINLCRGCGSKGLSSIPYIRDGIIRPMLDVTGEQVQAYALQHGLCWVEDESNADPYYLRNFMRREILPRLKSRTDVSFTKGFAATLQNLREESALLDELSCKQQPLSEMAPPLAWRRLKQQCPMLTRERFQRIMERLPEGDFKEQIAGETYAFCKNGVITFGPVPTNMGLECCPVTLPVTRLSDGREICFKEIHSQFTNFDIDCAKIGDVPLYFRSRKEGDRLTLGQRGCTKSLKKLFCEHHVTDRERRAVLTDGEKVIWVEGFGTDGAFAPDENTCCAWSVCFENKGE